MSNLLPPTPNRSFADHERRLAFLERRIDKAKIQPSTGRARSAFLTVAASDTDETLAAHATYRCDGVADQEEIQAAVDAAEGGWVILLEGNFAISGSVALRDGVRVMGAGATVVYSGVGYAFDCVFGHGASLERLAVTATAVGAGCFRSELGERIVALDRCLLTVDNGTVDRPAVRISGQNASVVACTIEANGADGIYVTSGSQHRAWIAGNCITQSVVGVQIDGRDTRVVANWVNATSHGLRVYAGTTYVLLAENVIQAGGDGILLEDAESTSIQGNTIVSAGGWGVHITDAASNNTFWTDNHVVAAVSGDFNDAGTGTIGNGGIPTLPALTESDIPPEIARDTEVTAAVSTHEGAADPHPTYATDDDLTTHAATPHGGAHPDLAAHDTLGLATQAELDTHAAGPHGGTHPDLAAHDTLGLATQAELDAHAATAHGTGSAEFVPYYLTTDETFTLPEYRQALFVEPIELDGGTLDVEGLLIEVSQPPDLSALVHMAGV